ncbi:hypothetical protein FRC04_002304 [Tulasnella sp. 424]|nr:hypothetical protein FRC04_002304 [Tulasnella sp. 424]
MHLPISLLVFTVVTVLAGAISSTPAGTQATPRAVRSGAERTTNAQRLAMNLPPLKPKRLTAILKARTGIVIPYLLPRKHLYDKFNRICNILVSDHDGMKLGYISPVLDNLGYYTIFQSQKTEAMEVTFSYSSDDRMPSELGLLVVNAPNSAYPYLGIATTSNIAPNLVSEDPVRYVNLVATSKTLAGSTAKSDLTSPAEDGEAETETAVWSYDPTTQELTPEWISIPDDSAYPAYILYCQSSNTLGTAQIAARWDPKPSGACGPVTFTCVDPES